MSVVLFEDCLEHLTRTHRILRMDRGNAMIIGVGGSGKKSICRLAAFAAGGFAINKVKQIDKEKNQANRHITTRCEACIDVFKIVVGT